MSSSEKKKKIITDGDIDLGQIFKNKTNIKHINTLIENFKNKVHSDVKAILIRGPIGCGKMTLIKACTKKYDLMDQVYNSEFDNEDILNRLMVSIKMCWFTDIKSGLRYSLLAFFMNVLAQYLSRGLATKVFLVLDLFQER